MKDDTAPLRIKKRVACIYGVIMQDGGMLGEYERSLLKYKRRRRACTSGLR